MEVYDVLVIGGGIAGASIGAEIASDNKVGLLEMEKGLSHHTTGRSAATYLESHGERIIRAITTSSRPFLENPPACFGGHLLTPRPLLLLGGDGRSDDIRARKEQVEEFVPTVRCVESGEAQEICPVLRPETVELGMMEPGASDIDVNALHQGYVKLLRTRGGEIHLNAKVVELTYRAPVWRITTGTGTVYEAPIVVNAAGAWADEIASLAGVEIIGLQHLLRSVFMARVPAEQDETDRLPLTADLDVNFYFKPESGQFLCSPADEVPSPPCDARPNEIEIARAIDEILKWTTIDARHVQSSWGGLRSFAYDRVPVACFQPDAPGFFWFAGQGGYGIQMSPALARCAASIIRGESLPNDVASKGLTPEDLHRDRFAHLTELADH